MGSRRRKSQDQNRQQRMQKKTSLGTGKHQCPLAHGAYLTKTKSFLPIPACQKLCGKCRDRAEERRRGVNPDYEDVQTQMANLASGNMQMQQGLGNISVEDSKFLGGDLKHTHLVKGLDYALLQKVYYHHF